MTIRGTAFIAGAYEHPDRVIPDRSLAQIHAEVALGALADAGPALADVDGYFCAGDAPGFGPLSMAEYLGLQLLLRRLHRHRRLVLHRARRPRRGGHRRRPVLGRPDHPGRPPRSQPPPRRGASAGARDGFEAPSG